jgi:hypothetical protein
VNRVVEKVSSPSPSEAEQTNNNKNDDNNNNAPSSPSVTPLRRFSGILSDNRLSVTGESQDH